MALNDLFPWTPRTGDPDSRENFSTLGKWLNLLRTSASAILQSVEARLNRLETRFNFEIKWRVRQYYTSQWDSFPALLTAIGSNSATVYVNSLVTLTGATTTPSNIHIKPMQGGGFTAASAVTLTVNGPVDAGLYQWIYGSVTVVFAKDVEGFPEWWGGAAGAGVVTTNIQACLTACRRVTFADKGIYETRQLSVPNNTVIWIFPGAVVKQSTGYASVENVFICSAVANVEINGFGGGIIRGIRTNDSEGRMAVRLDESEKIYVHDIILEDMDGDGIHIGASASAADLYCKDIHVERVKVDNCRRQGISVLTWDGLLRIGGCYFKDIGATNGTDPSAGIDIEPDSDFQRLGNAIIEDCLSENCEGAGFLVHLPAVDGDDDADKKCDMRFIRCRAVDCNQQGLRITSAINPFTRIEIEDFEAVGCGLSGILLGNTAVQSSIRFRGKTRLINNFTRTIDNTCPFPYWNSTGASSNGNKTDVLIYTNTVAAWESRNGGTGLIAGNIIFDDLEIFHDTGTDIEWFMADNYNQTDGAAGGTVRFPIRNVVFEKAWVRTTSNKTWLVDADYAQDIHFKDVKTWDSTNIRWNEAVDAHTGSTTLSDDTDQDLVHTNTGATALVPLTLPTAQGTVGWKQRFKAQVTDADGVSITCASGDFILLPGHPLPVSHVVSYDIGARIELEKYDATYWEVKRIWGKWTGSALVDAADSDYSIVRADHGKIISDNAATATRTFSLPTISATPSTTTEVPVGFEITLINRNSTYRMIIDPAASQSIIGLETSSAGRIQSGADGSSITLVAATSGGAWQVKSFHGAWYDLDGTINNAHRHPGNHLFLGTIGFSSGAGIASGTGTPEGVVTAPVGWLFLRSDGGAATTLYVKESGTGNTGWVAK